PSTRQSRARSSRPSGRTSPTRTIRSRRKLNSLPKYVVSKTLEQCPMELDADQGRRRGSGGRAEAGVRSGAPGPRKRRSGPDVDAPRSRRRVPALDLPGRARLGEAPLRGRIHAGCTQARRRQDDQHGRRKSTSTSRQEDPDTGRSPSRRAASPRRKRRLPPDVSSVMMRNGDAPPPCKDEMLLQNRKTITELLYLSDAYRRVFDARVVAVDAERGALAFDQTAFFPTGGGQPNDTGRLAFAATAAEVVDITKDSDGIVWHTLAAGTALPGLGEEVQGPIDWHRP